ncbi:MAG: Flagellar hook-associated protein FlgL [Actinomycetia bacterium]|nr:Flagellar hook-associated protein FlgL [Actinomycetes bacterium]
MSVRITPRTTQKTAIDNLGSTLSRMAQLQEQLASGKSINRPSDSPIQTVEAMQYRSEIRRSDQFQRNANDGLNWLGMADNTLTGVLSSLGRVKELVLQGINGSTDATQRGNIAQEVLALRDSLIGQGNAKYLDRPIFGGNAGGSAAYTATGTFIGSSGDVIERRVGPNQKVRVNLTGPEVFGNDGVGAAGNLFQIVDQIATDLQTNNTSALSTDLNALDLRRVTVENQLGAVGARYNQVDGMKSRAEDQQVTMKNGLSEVENIDLPKTIVDLQLQEIAYKSALSATSRVIQPSLLDFLR